MYLRYNLNSKLYVLISRQINDAYYYLFNMRPIDYQCSNKAFNKYLLIEEVQIFGGLGHPCGLMKGGSSP